jgi:hypothetical protein
MPPAQWSQIGEGIKPGKPVFLRLEIKYYVRLRKADWSSEP